MEQNRNIGMAILLTVVTCGIYGIYWMICLNDEINQASGNTQDPSGGMVFLLSLVTCGIYTFYWMYKMGEKLDCVAVSKGMAAGNRGVIYLILTFVGLGIVSYCLMQDSLNKLA